MFQKINMKPFQDICGVRLSSDYLQRSIRTILLVENIPGSGNAFFTLLASVDVEEVCKDHESLGCSDLATKLVLLDKAGQGNVEKDGPEHADLGPHLKVDVSNARIQAGTHKVVIEKVARHTMVCAHDGADNIHKRGHGEAPDNGDLDARCVPLARKAIPTHIQNLQS